jgi:hypothetical protein
MKIPIQLSFKLFNETTTVKTTVEDLHIGQTMEMYQKVMIPLFGVENYENTILQLANKIKDKNKPEVRIIKSEPKGILTWMDDLFND